MSVQNENDNIKKKVIRNKNKLYPLQRQQILNKLYEIIGINENKKTFYSHEIISDELKQNKINEMTEEILIYFNVSTWSAFKKKPVVENKIMSIIRSIFKEMSVNYESMTCKIKQNGKIINTTLYTLK